METRKTGCTDKRPMYGSPLLSFLLAEDIKCLAQSLYLIPLRRGLPLNPGLGQWLARPRDPLTVPIARAEGNSWLVLWVPALELRSYSSCLHQWTNSSALIAVDKLGLFLLFSFILKDCWQVFIEYSPCAGTTLDLWPLSVLWIFVTLCDRSCDSLFHKLNTCILKTKPKNVAYKQITLVIFSVFVFHFMNQTKI